MVQVVIKIIQVVIKIIQLLVEGGEEVKELERMWRLCFRRLLEI